MNKNIYNDFTNILKNNKAKSKNLKYYKGT